MALVQGALDIQHSKHSPLEQGKSAVVKPQDLFHPLQSPIFLISS